MIVNIVNKSPFDLPKYAKYGDAGMDLKAVITEEWLYKQQSENKKYSYSILNSPTDKPLIKTQGKLSITIEPNHRVLIPTGIYIQLPFGYEAQIRSRSGLSLKHGLVVAQGIGTLDSSYTGEIHIILYNISNKPQIIKHGDRIAQMVIAKHEIVEWNQVTTLQETERGAGGFGSTGKN